MAMTFWQELDELRARVKALEAKYETMRLAALEWGKDVENLQRWSDQHLLRIERLEADATCPHIVSSDEGTSYCDLAQQTQDKLDRLIAQDRDDAPTRAGSLVERVAGAIHPDRCADPNLYLHEARAAIREVAAYMQENYADTDWVTTAAVACVIADLKEESDR